MSKAGNGSIELEGDSTLHGYSARTNVFGAVVEIPDPAHATDLEGALRGAHVKSVTLTIPVNCLTSGDDTLDRQMWKALKDERFASIRFVADSFRVTAPAGGASFGLAMRGRLEIAGAERPVDVDAQGFRTTGGVRIVGRKDLLMTDFDIEPPRLMWGALKTANRVVVKFDIELHTSAARP